MRSQQRSGVSTQRCPAPGSVTETMKEFAGQRAHLVDSYEPRPSATSSFSSGNSRPVLRKQSVGPPETDGPVLRKQGHAPRKRGTALRTEGPGAVPQVSRNPRTAPRSPGGRRALHRSIVDFETKNGGDENAAARTAGHGRAGPAAARRRGRAGPHRTRCDDHRPQGPEPLSVGRRTGPDRPRLAARRRGLRAVRPHPRERRGRGPGRGRGGARRHPRRPGRGLRPAPAAAVRRERVGRLRHDHRARRAPGLGRARRGPGRRGRAAPADDDLGPGGRRPRRGPRPPRHRPRPARLGPLARRTAHRGLEARGRRAARGDPRRAGRGASHGGPQRAPGTAPGDGGPGDVLALPGPLRRARPGRPPGRPRDGALRLAARRRGGRRGLAR